MSTLKEMSIREASEKAIEILLWGSYIDAQKGRKYRAPYTGTFEEYVSNYYGEDDLDSGSIWSEFKYETASGERDGWSAKVVATYGGDEGQGDQYWMVVSISDGETTRYFRKDGWYASYIGGELDGDTYEVRPQERVVTFYES